jgi:hypothetical protein
MVIASSDRSEGKTSMKCVRKRNQPRKHPLAPKKPRSAFILFSQHMHNGEKKDNEYKELLNKVKISIINLGIYSLNLVQLWLDLTGHHLILT